MDGHHHKNEESWHDGCRECYCHNGREMCALITCPVPACGNPTIHPGQCCPSCSGKRWLPSCALLSKMTSALQGLIASVSVGGLAGDDSQSTSQLPVAFVSNNHRISQVLVMISRRPEKMQKL